MVLSDKQKEYMRYAVRRWNVKCGAARSGKTFVDLFMLPKRLRAMSGKPGLAVIIGASRPALRRNVLAPLRALWGDALVGEPDSSGFAYMFGERVCCLGASSVSCVNALRGASVKYCLGDEVTVWNADVFSMLMSRLDKPYSVFDGSCNPDSPSHWFKKFIDRADIDIFRQDYGIYDNPFLAPSFVSALEREYEGTVWYDRLILGKWKCAQGCVFPKFAACPPDFFVSREALPRSFVSCCAGFDLGGNRSDYALVASALGDDGVLYVLECRQFSPSELAFEDVCGAALDFISHIEADFGVAVRACYVDDNCYTVINTLNRALPIFFPASSVKSSMPLRDRPIFLSSLMGRGRFKLVSGRCAPLAAQLEGAVFDSAASVPVIRDSPSFKIDSIDAFFYSVADEYPFLSDLG